MKRPSPHPFLADPDLPPDLNGRQVCATCSLPRDNAHHAMPDVPEQAEHRQRYGDD